jgi:G-patch domain.
MVRTSLPCSNSGSVEFNVLTWKISSQCLIIWCTGKGLGRKESGITDPIRPKLKFDTQGVGYDAAEQFTYNWWEKAFDKATSNIQVSSSEVSSLLLLISVKIFRLI